MAYEFGRDDTPYIIKRHSDTGQSYEKHAVTLYIQDTQYVYTKTADFNAPSCTIQYATPEQVDAHIAALQELRATWPQPEPVMTAEAAEARESSRWFETVAAG